MHKQPKVYKGWADAFGMGVSLACAIHCILLPVFFATLPVFGVEILRNIVLETITTVLSAVVGSWALLRGFRKHHHQIKPVALFIIAMVFLVIANFNGGTTEIILKIIVVTGIITAHSLNWLYSFRCHNPAHRH